MSNTMMRMIGRRVTLPALLLVALVAGVALPARAQTFEQLHEFPGSQVRSQAALLELDDGSFLGTTVEGGGSVFKLTPTGGGAYAFSTVHTFNHFLDGSYPQAALIEGSDGNFYGTNYQGGPHGYGTVFRVDSGGMLTVLHAFQYAMGAYPFAGLIQADDGDLYGTTLQGGTYGYGTAFKLSLAGNFSLLHSFQNSEGRYPYAELIQGLDGNLYGTTYTGGAFGYGTVFRLTAAGALTTLHSFQHSNGAHPYSPLVQASDGNFYGTTVSGGTNGYGTAFRISPSGTHTLLHSFAYGSGAHPYAGLVQGSDGDFYGTNYFGGAHGYGTVFRLTDGGTHTVLHSLQYSTGAYPYAELIQAADGQLYGTTYQGGQFGFGTVFRVTTGGAATILHSFQHNLQGAYPHSPLVQAASGAFYGTTSQGGTYNYGTAYRMDSTGAVTTLHSFDYSTGAYPYAPLIQGSDGNLYGTSFAGGNSGGGTIFRMTPAGAVTTLHAFSYPQSRYPWAGLVEGADGNFYGTTIHGGSNDWGTVFRVSPAGMFTILHAFQYSDGAYPYAGLTRGQDGNFYGAASYASSGNGTLFKVSTSGTFTLLHTFQYPDGSRPFAPPVQASDGNFYGTTHQGGAYNNGTIYRLTSAGVLTTLYSFQYSDGGYPWAGLTQASDGKLYGTTLNGGGSGRGTVFSFTLAGVFELLHSFDDANGAYPYAALIQATDGLLYGTTTNGGGGNSGTIYRIGLGTVLAPTTLTIAPSVAANSSVWGVDYTVPVTVNGGNSPAGTIDVSDGTNTCGITLPATSCDLPSTSVGTQVITAIYSGDAANQGSDAGTTHEVVQATSTVVLSCPDSVSYTGVAKEPCSAIVTGAGGLSQAVPVVYGANLDAGEVTASASYAGDANHSGSSAADGFTIDRASSTTVLACPASETYTGSAIEPCSATVTGIGGLSEPVAVTYANNVDAGIATASASFAGDANHTASNDSGGFTIEPASSSTVLDCPASETYTGSAIEPCSAIVTGVGGLSESVAVTYGNNIDAGIATASASFAGDANHSASNDAGEFTIEPASSSVAIVFESGPYTYRGSAYAATATVTGAGGLEQELSIVYGGDCLNVTVADGCTASAAFDGDANHIASSDSASITLEKADASILVTGYDVVYTGGAHTAAGAANGAGGEDLSALLDLDGTTHTNAGSYASDPWTFAGDANHNAANGTVANRIDKADADISVTPYHVVYDAQPHTAAGTATGVLGEALAGLNLSGTTHTNAGSYNDTWSFTDVTGNYRNAGGSLTDVIDPRDALVNFIGQTWWVTSGSSSTAAQVTLTASVQDPTGNALAGAKVDFIDAATGRVLAGNVTVSAVANAPANTGTANAVVTLSTGQFGAESYVILVRMSGNYANTDQPIDDKTATLVVSKPAATNETIGAGTYAALASRAGTYAGTTDDVSFAIGMKYNKSGANLQGKITLAVPQADGILYVKSNSITSMAVKTGNPKAVTIYTKSTLYKVLPDGSVVTLDGNVTLRVDVNDYASPSQDQVAFTVLSTRDSSLYYSNNWVLAAGAWKTVPQTIKSGATTVN